MHNISTNFAKMLVWKDEYDIKLWRHKEWTANTNDHHIPLIETAPMKIFCVRHCSCDFCWYFTATLLGWLGVIVLG